MNGGTVPFTVLLDRLPDQVLVGAIEHALNGRRPCQPDCDAPYYVEGTVTRGIWHTRVCLALAGMRYHVVVAAVRRDFPNTAPPQLIAQAAADSLAKMAPDLSAQGD